VLLTLGALITTVVMRGGLAWAVKVIHCPNSPKYPQSCKGTDRKDIMHGTNERDVMRAGRERDTLYGRAGPDALSGNGGPDTIYGGQGNDRILPGCHFDSCVARTKSTAGRETISLVETSRTKNTLVDRAMTRL
jgi:hypothetical protein